jgi:predicted ATPase
MGRWIGAVGEGGPWRWMWVTHWGCMVRFGEFELDVEQRTLRRGTDELHLEPQAFDLLALLVAQTGRVVRKPDLLDGVWGHRFLSESNITTRIKEIRRALDDDGTRQRVIANVRGIGYRFVLDVDQTEVVVGNRQPGPTLIGRDAALDELLQRLETSPLVTVVGPGGVGKSTLARAAISRLGDGTTSSLVELASLTSAAEVGSAIARSMQIIVEPGRADSFIAPLARRDAVVVLDTCEHLADDVGSLIDRVLAEPSRRVRFVATSRVRLGLPTELVMSLEPLDETAAALLFRERVASAGSRLDVASIDDARLDRVLAAIDRLPLTVEMLAARTATMGFDQVEATVLSATGLGQMTHRSPVRRHRSLASLVDWSVELLDPVAARRFADFSVFAGPVEATDAAAVLSSPDDPASPFDVADLTDHSLLMVDAAGDRTRHRMLDTVRAVAEQQLLASGRFAEVRARHARFVAAALAQVDRALRGPDEPVGRRRLDALVAEVRAANAWARTNDPALAAASCSLLHLAAYTSFWDEPVRWSAELHHTGDLDDHDAIHVRLLLAGAATNRSDLDMAADLALASIHPTDPHLRCIAWEILSDVAVYRGDLRGVHEYAARLADDGARTDDRHAITVGAVNVSMAITYSGEPDEGFALAQAVPRSRLAPSDEGWVHYATAEALSGRGNPEAAALFERALRSGRVGGSRLLASVAQTSLAAELTRAGRYDHARIAFAAAFADHLRHGNVVHGVTCLRNVSALLAETGDVEEAAVLAVAAQHAPRPSYGTESGQLDELSAALRDRLGADRFDTVATVGRELGIVDALQRALRVVEEPG